MTPGSPSPSEPNEEQMVLRAIKGDGAAFGDLYARYLDAIYRYVYFRVGDAAESEDLTEEVFVRAWKALPTYQAGKTRFSSWLYRIAHNLTIDHGRRRRPLPLDDSEEHPALIVSASPEDAVEKSQLMAALAAAVSSLSNEEQQVIILRFIEGLPHEEVAAIIGKSIEASRVIQYRALARLSGLLKR